MSTLRSLLVAVLLPAVVRAQDSSVTSPLPDWGPYASGMQGRLVATPADATASPFSVEIGERHWLDGGTEANPCTNCYNVWVASFLGSTVQISAGTLFELGHQRHIHIVNYPPPTGGSSGLHINCGNWKPSDGPGAMIVGLAGPAAHAWSAYSNAWTVNADGTVSPIVDNVARTEFALGWGSYRWASCTTASG